jgi:hypothetical protein
MNLQYFSEGISEERLIDVIYYRLDIFANELTSIIHSTPAHLRN